MRTGFIVLILALSACGQSEKKPAGILSHEQMVKALGEIYIVESKVNRMGITRDSALKVFDVMEGKLFEKENVPDSVFKASLNYYMDRPKELELIYSALVDSLNLKEQRSSFGEEKK